MNHKHAFLRRLALACATFGLAASTVVAPAFAQGQDKAAEFNRGVFDRAAAMEERRVYHDWLVSERVALARGKKLTAPVSAEEMAAIDNERGALPVRVGLTKSLDADISFRDVRAARLKGRSLSRRHGAMAGTSDGGYVFTAELGSAQATALRVHFTGFNLPEGASLYLYNDLGQVFGPYRSRGPHGDGSFWSHTVLGESVTLQLRQLGPASDADLRNTRFKIAGLAHVRPRFLGGQCSNNASCVESASCGGLDPAVNDAVNAAAHMQWVSGPYIYICSGGLLADTDAGSDRPLFLTANHCISRGKDARNMEAFFQLTTTGCSAGMSCDDIFDHQANHPQSLRTLGADILSTGRDADYTLMELRDPAPGGSAFMGWTSAEVAFSHGDPLYRISHPDGSPQAYSEHTVDTTAGQCSGSWSRGNRIYSRDILGATEGGSSGSPVVNAAGQVVGQLSGACGTNVNDTCDSVNNATVDGALAAYFSAVEQFLDPGTTCTPVPEDCSNGVDDDCDNLVDGDDPDCGGTGGLPPGASCTANDQCASNKCKGKPGSKTCN